MKFIRYIGYACFALLIPAAVILLLLLNSSLFKHVVETRSSESFSLDTEIRGPVSFSVAQGLQVTLHDLHASKDGKDLVAAGKLSIDLDAWALLRGEVRVNNIAVQDAVVSVVRFAGGGYNFTLPHSRLTLKLAHITIGNATIHFTDQSAAAEYTAASCNAELRALTPLDRTALEDPAAVDISATADCAELHRNNLLLTNVKLALAGNNRVFRFAPVTMEVFGAAGSGDVLADFTGAEPRYELNYQEQQFLIEHGFAVLAPGKSASGKMDFSARLTAQGRTLQAFKQTLAGQVSLQGTNLLLEGSDLDEQFEKYETTQNFNLVDAGAMLFAGPVGLVASKGLDYANLSAQSGTHSEIPAVVSQWTIAHGVAEATDVAMKTKRNLLALKGALDFPDGKFRNLHFALLDKHGCARVEQAVTGTFQHPEIAKPDILKSLAGPVIKLLNKLKPEEACTVFYAGSLDIPQ